MTPLGIRIERSATIGRGSPLLAVIVLWGFAALATLAFVWLNTDVAETYRNFYLLPWVLMTALVVAAPSVYLYLKGRFDIFHPLVFAAWSYIFPAFVIGGLIIAFDWVDWYFMSFIEDPRYNLPLTLVYISLGFAGLTAGYFLPVGRWAAERAERFLPSRDWPPDAVWLGGIVLLVLGVGFNIVGFLQGILGFQRNIDVGIFDGLLFFLVIVLTAGMVFLWIAVFTVKAKSGIYYVVLTLLIAFIPLRMALLGSRSSLVLGLLPIAFAFVYSGRRIKWQYSVAFGLVAAAALLIGVAYGTTFRNIKGSEARMDAGDYIGQVSATIDYLSAEDPFAVAGNTVQALASRVENLSSVAVVVSNYEKLAPYEASYGLDNNILNDLYTSFIPRFVWADKPSTSDTRAYSDLYFDFGENSFAISPFGDLLRNFGPAGVPLGMMLLGVYLRFIYRGLIETPTPTIWKKVAYFLLLTVVSYEAFYATIFPSVIRTIFVLVLALLVVKLFMGRRSAPAARS